MKNITKLILGACISSSMLMTGCIDETFPTSGATEDQLTSSEKALDAMVWAMPAYFNTFQLLPLRQDYDWGYGSLMHIRDVQTGDMAALYSGSGYDWYVNWATCKSMDEDKMLQQYPWWYYYKFIQTANNVIAVIDPETASEGQLGYLGAAHAFRALGYLDAAQMYEFLDNDAISSVNKSGNDVLHLTVPIVRENMTEEEARNNPRATREQMAEFLLGELQAAETYIPHLTETSRTLPHLAAVYGLYARYYMWLAASGAEEQPQYFTQARDYARKAINAYGQAPMTEQQCLNTTTGFNDLSCWMWGSQLAGEDDQVKSGIITWASWMSNETTYGYTGAEPFLMIDANMYARISDTDFRKRLWKAPEGGLLEGQTPFIDEEWGNDLPAYASVKFRPGQGDMEDPTTGNVVAFPVMRVEEMYFIEAEAAEHVAPGEGKQLLESFMQTYRDPQYTCRAVDVVDEIVFQKRVELWGEGLTFFDIKRLNMSVTRGYSGTNFQDMARFNTNGRPAWMNMVIVSQERDNNTALIGWENPDVTDCYTPWVEGQ